MDLLEGLLILAIIGVLVFLVMQRKKKTLLQQQEALVKKHAEAQGFDGEALVHDVEEESINQLNSQPQPKPVEDEKIEEEVEDEDCLRVVDGKCPIEGFTADAKGCCHLPKASATIERLKGAGAMANLLVADVLITDVAPSLTTKFGNRLSRATIQRGILKATRRIGQMAVRRLTSFISKLAASGPAAVLFEAFSIAFDLADPMGYDNFTMNKITEDALDRAMLDTQQFALQNDLEYPMLFPIRELYKTEFDKVYQNQVMEKYSSIALRNMGMENTDEHWVEVNGELEWNPPAEFETRLDEEMLKAVNAKPKERDQFIYSALKKEPTVNNAYIAIYPDMSSAKTFGISLTPQGLDYYNSLHKPDWLRYNDVFDKEIQTPEDYVEKPIALWTNKQVFLDKENPGTTEKPNMTYSHFPYNKFYPLAVYHAGHVVTYCEKFRKADKFFDNWDDGIKTALSVVSPFAAITFQMRRAAKGMDPTEYGVYFDFGTQRGAYGCMYNNSFCHHFGQKIVYDTRTHKSECHPVIPDFIPGFAKEAWKGFHKLGGFVCNPDCQPDQYCENNGCHAKKKIGEHVGIGADWKCLSGYEAFSHCVECKFNDDSLCPPGHKCRNDKCYKLENEWENCWKPCGNKAGLCAFCGSGGACCRHNENQDLPECQGHGPSGWHSCIERKDGETLADEERRISNLILFSIVSKDGAIIEVDQPTHGKLMTTFSSQKGIDDKFITVNAKNLMKSPLISAGMTMITQPVTNKVLLLIARKKFDYNEAYIRGRLDSFEWHTLTQYANTDLSKIKRTYSNGDREFCELLQGSEYERSVFCRDLQTKLAQETQRAQDLAKRQEENVENGGGKFFGSHECNPACDPNFEYCDLGVCQRKKNIGEEVGPMGGWKCMSGQEAFSRCIECKHNDSSMCPAGMTCRNDACYEIANELKSCWDQCDHKAGRCDGFCGYGGACCRHNENQDLPECRGHGDAFEHKCIIRRDLRDYREERDSRMTNASTPLDVNDNCAMWAAAGECEKNPGYMKPNCAQSCANQANSELQQNFENMLEGLNNSENQKGGLLGNLVANLVQNNRNNNKDVVKKSM